MSLQSQQRVYLLEIRVHDIERKIDEIIHVQKTETDKIWRVLNDLIEVVNPELKH